METKEEIVEKSNNNSNSTIIYFLLILIVVLLIVAGFIGFLYYKEKTSEPKNPVEVANEEVERIKNLVSKHIILPEEEPAIATIVDIEALKKDNPEFYKNAQNDDKVLIFSQKAIIYRPSQDILINVAPVIQQPDQIEKQQEESSTSESQSQVQSITSADIEIRNGSYTNGAGSDAQELIEQNFDNINIIKVENASASNYSGNTLYVLTDQKDMSTFLTDLANAFNAEISIDFPSNESNSTADAVLILGNL